MMNPMSNLLRRLVTGDERILAQQAMRRLAPADRDWKSFVRTLVGPARPGDIILGKVQRPDGRWATVRIPANLVCTMHAAFNGASGSGKSRLVMLAILQLIRARICTVLLDCKSETARALRDVIVPYLIAETGDESLLDRIRVVVNPFDTAVVPPLNLTQREEGVSVEAQAFSIVASVEEALADVLSPRSRPVLLRLTSAAISLERPLPTIQEWLADPASFARDAGRSIDPAIREYARSGFQHENRESLRSIGSRLSAFLFLPETRRALAARSCVRFSDIDRAGGLTIIDVGSPPAGSEQLMRFWGGPLVGMLTRGALSRTITPETVPVVLVLEEIQEVIGPQEARSLARLMSVARYRRCAVWTTNQSRSQLLRVDRNLVEAISTNVGFQAQFRSSLSDAQAFAHLLPEGGGESRAAARREQIEELTRLRKRHYYLALRDAPFRARVVRTQSLDFDELTRAAGALPADVRERIARAGVLPDAEPEPTAAETVTPEPTSLPPRPKPTAPVDPGTFPGLG